ncbi:soluble scavenger receptor cysteine-rich domain-containing protein SSC5D-like isoform X2 [Mizuhopecten yessoensis]|uniref:Neurotrypsin n=1 Tax=Mizuhopecten yessoensis TaxID=6573 RepID=A0A210QN76_MIZYE|nr:soluble scavenger receptor cysteine-rich domain-containing protein SSC5D-like isoform X2 [Mizuhopecten yessoensis]OWF50158.1 Neurotrypsin [Mizuhopecten yessoensis]
MLSPEIFQTENRSAGKMKRLIRLSITFVLLLISSVHLSIINHVHFDDDTRRVAYHTAAPYGTLQCGKMCALEGRCIAINYHKGARTCELVEQAATVVLDSAGWVSTSDITFVNGKLGSCSNVSIPELNECVPLRNGGQTSMIKYCPATPSVPSCYTTSTSRSVRDAVTYKCNPDFNCTENLNGICLPNGQWSSSSSIAQCFQDSVRLDSGTNQTEGRVEIYRDGVWGKVIGASWYANDAAVACRQLGYSGGNATLKLKSDFGKLWSKSGECVGNELKIADCPIDWFPILQNWRPFNAGVNCTGN